MVPMTLSDCDVARRFPAPRCNLAVVVCMSSVRLFAREGLPREGLFPVVKVAWAMAAHPFPSVMGFFR